MQGLLSQHLNERQLPTMTVFTQMWDSKSIREAKGMSLAVFPQHLRPAKYDAARLTYLEHMTVREVAIMKV